MLRKIENVPTGPNNKPKLPVIISQCGEMWHTPTRLCVTNVSQIDETVCLECDMHS